MKKKKRRYKDEIGAMFALSQCKRAARFGNFRRREQRAYEFRGGWYLTSETDRKTGGC